MAGETQTSQGGAPAGMVTVPATTQVVQSPAPVVVTRQETNSFVMRLIGHHGTAENALTHLASEQLRYRKRAKRAESVAAKLQKQLPTAGSVVLSGDDAKAFLEFQKANPQFKLADLTTTVKELTDLRSKSAKDSRAAALKTAAGKKYKFNMLAMALGDTPLEFKKVLQRDEESDDENAMIEVEVPYVKHNDTLELLDTWLPRERPDFKDLIAAEESDEETSSKSTDKTQTGTTQKATGTRLPRQTGTPPAKKGDAKTKDIIKTVDARMSKFVLPSQRNKAAEKTT